jgi:hypothetical protein
MESKRKSDRGKQSRPKKVSSCVDKTNQGVSCFPNVFKNTRFRPECNDYCREHRKLILFKIVRMLLETINVMDKVGVDVDCELTTLRIVSARTREVNLFMVKDEERYDDVPDEKVQKWVDALEHGGELECGYEFIGDVFPKNLSTVIGWWEKIAIELDESNFTYHTEHNPFRTDNRPSLSLTIVFPAV